MALGDRVFSYWHRPASGDGVGWLLWMLGWSVPLGAGLTWGCYAVEFASWPDRTWSMDLASLFVAWVFVFVAGCALFFSWIISGTYTAWQAKSSKARSWAAQIAVLALFFAVAPFVGRLGPHEWFIDVPAISRGLVGIAVLALLVAGRRTAPPASTSS